MSAEASIPYEAQDDPQNHRTCGAACLSMVYRSLGKEVQQKEIWPAIAKPNQFGSVSSTTHLMVRDALKRGFVAVAIQARHPLQALRLCRESGIRGILNHRLNREVPIGHYSVLVDLDDKTVVLHDPFFGPSRRISHPELLELWQPLMPNSEILGNVLIGLIAAPAPWPPCQFCRTPSLPNIECPRCKQPVGLQPGALLGCINNACIARMWNYLDCPSCDYMWSFSLQPQDAGAPVSDASSSPSSAKQAAAESLEDPLNLSHVLGEVDKFCSALLSIPAAANHPDVRRQMDFITAAKEKLKLAQVEQAASINAVQEKVAAMGQLAQQRAEAHRKRMQELNTPAPPLDGDALGRALLKNLGFTH
jgi:peptidase C39-like protein